MLIEYMRNQSAAAASKKTKSSFSRRTLTKSRAGLRKLALSHGCGTTLDRSSLPRHLLLTLSDVMQSLAINILTGVLLCLSGRSSLHWRVFARDLFLGLGDFGDHRGLKLASVGVGFLYILGISTKPLLWGGIMSERTYGIVGA